MMENQCFTGNVVQKWIPCCSHVLPGGCRNTRVVTWRRHSAELRQVHRFWKFWYEVEFICVVWPQLFNSRRVFTYLSLLWFGLWKICLTSLWITLLLLSMHRTYKILTILVTRQRVDLKLASWNLQGINPVLMSKSAHFNETYSDGCYGAVIRYTARIISYTNGSLYGLCTQFRSSWVLSSSLPTSFWLRREQICCCY